MDDILKRMLAVESEADAIISGAQETSEKIMEDARMQSNELATRMQSDLSTEAEHLVESRLEEARRTKGERLAEENRKTDLELKEFERGLEAHLPELTDALLFGFE